MAYIKSLEKHCIQTLTINVSNPLVIIKKNLQMVFLLNYLFAGFFYQRWQKLSLYKRLQNYY